MRYFSWVFLCLGLLLVGCGVCAGEAPAVDLSPEASVIWSILAGQGTWGVLIFAVLGVLWKWAKPYLEAWMAERKLKRLYEAVRDGIAGTWQTFADPIKEASADGKLTEAEAKAAKEKCKSYIIAYMKAQGVDVIREYGHGLLDYLIEAVLRQLKLDNALVKAVALPLPDLAPSRTSVPAPGPQAVTVGDFGLTTP